METIHLSDIKIHRFVQLYLDETKARPGRSPPTDQNKFQFCHFNWKIITFVLFCSSFGNATKVLTV